MPSLADAQSETYKTYRRALQTLALHDCSQLPSSHPSTFIPADSIPVSMPRNTSAPASHDSPAKRFSLSSGDTVPHPKL
jgi:hypothetical protein